MAYDKLVDSAAIDAGLTAIADAIREKGGTTEELSFPDGMEAAVYAIEAGGGDTSIEDSLVTRTVTTYSNDRVTSVGEYAFANCESLTSLALPLVKGLSNYMCSGATALETVDMLGGGNIGNNSLLDCSAMRSLVFRNEHAATMCAKTRYPFTAYVGEANITRNFTRAQWNNYGDIGHTESWTGLTAMQAGSITYISGTITNEDSKPVWMFGQYVAYGTRLETIAFVETEEEANALMTEYERQHNIEGPVHVYVPRSIIGEYQADEGWLYGGQVRALEDYTVDGTITGALDDTKI